MSPAADAAVRARARGAGALVGRAQPALHDGGGGGRRLRVRRCSVRRSGARPHPRFWERRHGAGAMGARVRASLHHCEAPLVNYSPTAQNLYFARNYTLGEGGEVGDETLKDHSKCYSPPSRFLSRRPKHASALGENYHTQYSPLRRSLNRCHEHARKLVGTTPWSICRAPAARCHQNLTQVCQTWPALDQLAQTWPTLVKLGRVLPEVGGRCPKFTQELFLESFLE